MATPLRLLHILSPAAILTCFLVSSLWKTISTNDDDDAPASETLEPSASSAVQRAPDPKKEPRFTRSQRLQRGIQIILSALTGLLYISEAIALAFSQTPNQKAGTADENIVFALFSSLVWLILILSLLDVGAASKGRNFRATWIVASAFETIVFCVSLESANKYSSHVRVTQVVLQTVRIATEMILVASEYLDHFTQVPASDEEIAPLLVGGTTTADQKDDTEDSDKVDDVDLRRISKNWWLYVKGFKLFLPIIRPKTTRHYLCILGVCFCVAIERILNVAAPVTLGAIVTTLSKHNDIDKDNDRLSMPWAPIFLYAGLMTLESSAGVSLARDLLWQPVEQVAVQNMKRAAYDKLMSLSCDFHDSKKSDVTFQTMQRGSRIIDLLDTIFFELLPMTADLVISISVFWYLFDGYVGFVVGLVVVLFMWSTLKSLSARSGLWREFIKIWEREWYAMTESIKSWDAVSHFGRIPYEINNYKEKTDDTRNMQMRWLILSKFLGSLRSIILIGGMTAGACIVAHQVVKGNIDVGKFIVFITYWSQLSTPLHFFARGFNSISKGLVDAEKLLSLFEMKPTIQNADEAVPFVLKEGAVDFKNVSFSYDGKRTVTNQVTFHAEPGKMIAFVGETGCGKSTLFKLLFRFYDPKEGTICIDGQDIKDLTLDSFREHLGIVPQEPALFNKSIRENLRYPDLQATDEQIEDACKAVSLHEKITSFTKGYEEVIGERGTKLSGGERQRVAIARAILKNPSILLLDEATSSVDSTTEAQIQASLKALCAERTTFVIAHRLSTIINADQVVVMDDGKIVESGTHASLIKQNGPYRKLWMSQLSGHISELRGRSKSRSKCRKEDEHLLVIDLNSSDEDAKTLLAETIESQGYVVANKQSKATKEVSSHNVSHEKQREAGRNTSGSHVIASCTAFSSSKSQRPASQTVPGAVIGNLRYSHMQRAVSPGKSTRTAISAAGIEEETFDLDVATRPRPVTDSQEPTRQNVPPVERHGDNGNEEAPEEGLKVPHSSAEAARRRNQSASEPANQDPAPLDGADEYEHFSAPGMSKKTYCSQRKGQSAGMMRSASHPGGPPTANGSAEPSYGRKDANVTCGNTDGGSKFKLQNGKLVGGLKSVGLTQNIKNKKGSTQESGTEIQAMNGSMTPMLKAPAGAHAREQTPSPGTLSEDGGAALDDGSASKE